MIINIDSKKKHPILINNMSLSKLPPIETRDSINVDKQKSNRLLKIDGGCNDASPFTYD